MGEIEYPELLCEVCKKNLSTALERGWVSWLTVGGVRKVQSFHVTCAGGCTMLAHGGNSIQLHQRGLSVSDNHLLSFTGIMATKRLCQLLHLYDWSEATLTRLTNFFVVASALPSDSRHRIELHDDFMGGLPLAPCILESYEQLVLSTIDKRGGIDRVTLATDLGGELTPRGTWGAYLKVAEDMILRMSRTGAIERESPNGFWRRAKAPTTP